MNHQRRKQIELESIDGLEISEDVLDDVVETLAEWLWADLENERMKPSEAEKYAKAKPNQLEFDPGN